MEFEGDCERRFDGHSEDMTLGAAAPTIKKALSSSSRKKGPNWTISSCVYVSLIYFQFPIPTLTLTF